MPIYSLRSKLNPELELFSGEFKSHGKAVEEAIRNGVSLENVNLSEAHLSGTDFSDGNLSGADFRKAILTGSKLDRANFKKADLTGGYLDWSSGRNLHASAAIFRDVRLSRSVFFDSDFMNTDFCLSEAQGSVFSNCSLQKAQLSPAVFGTDLSSTRLAEATIFGIFGIEYKIPNAQSYLRISNVINTHFIGSISVIKTEQETLVHYTPSVNQKPIGNSFLVPVTFISREPRSFIMTVNSFLDHLDKLTDVPSSKNLIRTFSEFIESFSQ